MSSFPFVATSNIFNTVDYNVLDKGLTRTTTDQLYLSLGGGTVGYLSITGTLSTTSIANSGSITTASLTSTGNVDAASFSISGASINLSAISGVTAGIASASKALIVDSSRNITNINQITAATISASTSLSSAIINGNAYLYSGSSMLASSLTSVTAGTCSASKALIVDANKDIDGIGIIRSNGIAITPTNYTLTVPNIPGCLWRTDSTRLCAFREIDSNNWSWGYSGGGVWNDIFVMSNSTYRITVNGDLNYTGSLRSSGTVVLDSSRNLTAADITATGITATTSITAPLANIRDNAQAHNTRIEYLSLGRSSSGSDHGAWSFMNYYSSSTQGDSNYITFTPRLRTSLTNGWGFCMTQNGNCSFQDKNSNSGAGGIKTQANIVGTVDIQGGITRTIGAGHGYLQANSGSPSAYNASSVSTRIGLWVENAIWCGDKVYASSDSRLKRDIKTIPLDEAKKLLNINAVSYRWQKDIDDRFLPDIGFIAQDLLENKLDKIVSFCPSSDKEKFPLGYSYGLEYQKVCVYQNELIKDLYVQIEDFKKTSNMKVLNTNIIQKLIERVELLENKLKNIKSNIQ